MNNVNPYFEELSDVEIKMKICRRCDKKKHVNDFAHRAFKKDGSKEYKNYCKACDSIAQRQVALIKKKFGTVPVDHKCECCGRAEKEILESYRIFQGTMKKTVWVYDHDFYSGEFRGIICQPCNSIVGNVQDNIVHAKNVVEYLKG